jgi:DNA polymerase-3 subunit gamma/tau
MPDPSELARLLAGGLPAPAGAPSGFPSTSAPVSPTPASHGVEPALPVDFRAMVGLVDSAHPTLGGELTDCVGLIRYQPPFLEIRLSKPLVAEFGDRLRRALDTLTGVRWTVRLGDGPAQPTLRDQDAALERGREQAIWASPVGQAVKQAFPDAELAGIEPARLSNSGN